MRRNLNAERVLSVDFFDGFVCRFIQETLAISSADESGLYNYYASRLDHHVGGLQDYEVAIFEFLTAKFPRCACFIHVGVGIGTTTALMAATGHKIIGIEKDPKRLALASRLRSCAAALWPNVANLYELVQGVFPQVLSNFGRRADSVLFLTNFGAKRSSGFIDEMIRTLPEFNNVVLDLRLFGNTLEDPADREALRTRILAAGMKDRGPIRASPGSHYHHFVPNNQS
jgi:hypothetical protein